MKWLLACAFIMFRLAAYSQPAKPLNFDSLEAKLSKLNDGPVKIFVLNKLFFHYLNNDSKKALGFAATGLSTAEKLKRDTDICVFYDCMGEAYFYLANAKASLYYYKKDYELASKIRLKKQMALALNDMSAVYQMLGDDLTAQGSYFKSLKLWEELKDNRQIAVCYLNIGTTYNNQNDYRKTIFFGEKALTFVKKLNDKDVEAHAYELIGSGYLLEADFNNARKYLGQALQLYTKIKNDYGVATILYLLAITYPGQYQKQLDIALSSQNLWDKIAPENFNSINNLGHIGSDYGSMAMQQHAAEKRNALFKKSENYLLRAIGIAKKTDARSVIMDFSDSLALVDAAQGKYAQAYKNLRIYNKLYDSIYSQDNKNKIAALEGKHDIELRDKQLLINKLELANQQKQRGVLLTGIIALIFILILIYYQSIQRKKANKNLSTLNQQLNEANKIKTRFFNILNHDLRSPISGFVNFLHLQKDAPDLLDEAATAAYSQKATTAAENLLHTMEDLLLWSKGQMENFKPNPITISVNELFDYINTTLAAPSNVTIKFHRTGLELFTDEHYIKTIMQNLTSNAVKAVGNKHDGSITWDAWEENSFKYLSITDNGPGAADGQLKPLYDETATVGIKNGLGLHIVRDLARAIRCEISVHSEKDKGVMIKLKFTS